jgi:hypothetical protein
MNVLAAIDRGEWSDSCEADYSPAFSAQVKKEYSYTSTPPYIIMVHGTSQVYLCVCVCVCVCVCARVHRHVAFHVRLLILFPPHLHLICFQ